jgi:Fe-S-cluster containining protein
LEVDLKVVKPDDSEAPKKEGNCKLCGLCCRWLAVGKVDNEQGDYARWIKLRGGRVVNHIGFLPSKCDYIESGQRCGIYNTRPAFCKIFPEDGLNFLKELGCKYYD